MSICVRIQFCHTQKWAREQWNGLPRLTPAFPLSQWNGDAEHFSAIDHIWMQTNTFFSNELDSKMIDLMANAIFHPVNLAYANSMLSMFCTQCSPVFAIFICFGMLFSGAFVALINIESQARQRIYCFFWRLKCKINENATLFCRRSFDGLLAILQMNFSVLFIHIFMAWRDATQRDTICQ